MTKENEAVIGHNSENVSGARLKSFIERVERLEEEKKGMSDDIKDIYLEAKSAGFDTKIIRKLVSIRRVTEQKRREEAELLSLYAAAIQLDLGF